ncbi:hypothetical protein BDQ12DRAFT_376991 [Crucibulum laeve]|uniref:Uncharacterized protein n=1 Tax=Crucibulum laeve TaxID=68775 RepID=A0A5C3LMW3_9AGAR|nr:hypothetical protein BDQ12DRAFT_376991 [Crucibulum laeve]
MMSKRILGWRVTSGSREGVFILVPCGSPLHGSPDTPCIPRITSVQHSSRSMLFVEIVVVGAVVVGRGQRVLVMMRKCRAWLPLHLYM